MLMVGFEGEAPTKEIEQMIKRDHLGGVILFARNIVSAEQVRQLCARLKAVAASANVPPPLIAIDHEGGVVTRFKDEVTPLPSNMALGATRSAQYAYQTGQIAGTELSSLGIDINLAPVLDLATNPKSPLGVRSFGHDPVLAAKLGAALIKGMQSQGISATAKHFPGKGEASLDSHLELPTVSGSIERLEEIELYPFREAITAGVGLVMTSHAVFTALDPTRPATLSSKIITDLLRKKMGFKGVVITDDLEMGAITNWGLGIGDWGLRNVMSGTRNRYNPQSAIRNPQSGIGVPEAAVMAVKAGVDIALICHSPEKQKAALEAFRIAVERKEITEERINQSIHRINRLRIAHPLRGYPGLRIARPEVKTIRNPKSAIRNMMRDAVTLVKDDQKLIPLKAELTQSVLIVSTTQTPLTRVEDTREVPIADCGLRIADCGLRNMKSEIRTVVVDIRPGKDESANPQSAIPGTHEVGAQSAIHQVISLARKAGVTIFITCNAHQYPEQAQLVRGILALKKPLIVVAARDPYDLASFPAAGTYLATYWPHPFSLQAALEVIFGKFSPGGQLPVRV
ncbi:MAG: beta-N-acetylhexosaminidase [bacterium]|nr:beta-N-acetylhexosaminidase [bacterium]